MYLTVEHFGSSSTADQHEEKQPEVIVQRGEEERMVNVL